jgi:hypothetical protein
MGVRPLMEIYLVIVLDIILGKGGKQTIDIQNDRFDMEL